MAFDVLFLSQPQGAGEVADGDEAAAVGGHRDVGEGLELRQGQDVAQQIHEDQAEAGSDQSSPDQPLPLR